MVAAWKATKRQPIRGWDWRIEQVQLPPRTEKSFSAEESRRLLENPKEPKARRGNAAFQLAWLKRRDQPIEISCLDFGHVAVVHLPGEPFIEYQLYAQEQRPNSPAQDAFVCVAGYGDGGPGYIPTARAYAEGGYETTVALAGPDSEAILRNALAKLLKSRVG
jgi:hypothetical protein